MLGERLAHRRPEAFSHRVREHIVQPAKAGTGKVGHRLLDDPPAHLPPPNWMERRKRVFHIDIEHCPVCRGTLRVIACIDAPDPSIDAPDLIDRILAHLAAREADSVHPPRAPPPSVPGADLAASPSLVTS